jgi:hypothetical protein
MSDKDIEPTWTVQNAGVGLNADGLGRFRRFLPTFTFLIRA